MKKNCGKELKKYLLRGVWCRLMPINHYFGNNLHGFNFYLLLWQIDSYLKL